MKINIGCCGFPISMKKYFREFSTVEVQQTFYRIPKENTLKKWRKQAGKDFIFNIKCFQGVTHPLTSPTWKRFGKKPKGIYGLLQPSKEVFESWEKTLKAARILKARIILIQLPASFKENDQSFENAEKFFSEINRDNFEIAIELRGWSEEGVKKFCKKFELIDCCDLNVRKPFYLSKNKILYSRLHGAYKNGKIIYSYNYSKDELKNIAEKIRKIKTKEVWIYFNNSEMYKNAKEFEKLIDRKREE